MSDKAPFEIVSKIDATERQLCVAIRLFFERGDVVCIHTLTAAAKGILQDLCRERGIKAVLEDSNLVRPEKRAELNAILRRPQNFFKHADRDGDEELKFHYEVTKYFILEAVFLYGQLMSGKVFPEGNIFASWMFLKRSHLLTDGPLKEVFQTAAAGLDLDDFSGILDALARVKPSGRKA